MVFSGYKNHSLFMNLHYAPQHIKQQCLLVIRTDVEE